MDGNTLTILAAAEYPLHRDLALRLKRGDKDAAAQAADILLGLLPEGPLTLVPVPSHTGRPTYMLHVAQILAQRRGTASTAVFPYLRTRPHASRHDAKHGGADPRTLTAPTTFLPGDRCLLRLRERARRSTLVLLDDIADTGATLREASRATGAATAAVLAATGRIYLTEEAPEKKALAEDPEMGLFIESLIRTIATRSLNTTTR